MSRFHAGEKPLERDGDNRDQGLGYTETMVYDASVEIALAAIVRELSLIKQHLQLITGHEIEEYHDNH